MEEWKEFVKEEDQDLIKYIFDLSKEMNVQSNCGVVGNELELIALVRKCNFLYDKSLFDFKDVRKKNVAWSAIASVMHCKVHEVQQRWRSLREGYNKYKKEVESASDDNALIRPWEFYEEMKFIDPYLVRRSHLRQNKSLNDSDSIELEGNLSNDAIDNKIVDRNVDIMKLISCIKTKPVLYDNKHPNYKTKESKTHAWNEVAQVLGSSANDCELKWKTLRERYGRERKIKYAQNDRKKWEYFDVLNFLDTHVKPRKHSIFRPILPKLEDGKSNLATLSPLLNHIPANNHQTVILKQLIKSASPVHDIDVKNDNTI
ncbi:hypothetical protein RN001_008800 [Aquatica leii]|uniref:MADF domain-containing protein n=1 Tax=Aquatica leii TaxID=1421715 RepID=A0AAN7PXR1_9COLE|nr:hypothetical protein RN001_008800 [Aquatica leii]